MKKYIENQAKGVDISPMQKREKQSTAKQENMTLARTSSSQDAESSGKAYPRISTVTQAKECDRMENILEKGKKLSDSRNDYEFSPDNIDASFTIQSSRKSGLTNETKSLEVHSTGLGNADHSKPGALTPLSQNLETDTGLENALKMEDQFHNKCKTGVNTKNVDMDLKIKQFYKIPLTEDKQQTFKLDNSSPSLESDRIPENTKLSDENFSTPGESSEQGTDSTYVSQEDPPGRQSQDKALSNNMNSSLTTSVSSRWWRDVEYAMSTFSSSKGSSSQETPPRKAFRTLEVPTVGRRTRHFPFSSLKVLKGSNTQPFYTRPSFRGAASRYTINSLRRRSEEAESSIIRNRNANLSSPTRSIPWIDDIDQDIILSPGRGEEFDNSLCCSFGTCALCYKVLLLVLIVVLLTLGSVVFYATEKSTISERDMLLSEVERTLESFSFNCTAERNSTEVKRQLFLFGTVLLGIKTAHQSTTAWEYKDSLLLSFSMISSTGISIKLSSSGRIFGIFYTLFGLPLSVMFIWIYSRTLSRFLKGLYMKTVPDIGRSHPPRRYSIEDPGYGELRQIPLKISVPFFSIISVILVAILHVITKGGTLTCVFMFVQLVFLNSVPYTSTSTLTSTGSVIAYVIYGYFVFIITSTCVRLSYKPFKRLLPKMDISVASLGFKLKSKISRANGGPVNRMNSTQLSMKINELTLPTTFVNSRVMNLDAGGRNLGIMTKY